jgi:hypothetical protein
MLPGALTSHPLPTACHAFMHTCCMPHAQGLSIHMCVTSRRDQAVVSIACLTACPHTHGRKPMVATPAL